MASSAPFLALARKSQLFAEFAVCDLSQRGRKLAVKSVPTIAWGLQVDGFVGFDFHYPL